MSFTNVPPLAVFVCPGLPLLLEGLSDLPACGRFARLRLPPEQANGILAPISARPPGAFFPSRWMLSSATTDPGPRLAPGKRAQETDLTTRGERHTPRAKSAPPRGGSPFLPPRRCREDPSTTPRRRCRFNRPARQIQLVADYWSSQRDLSGAPGRRSGRTPAKSDRRWPAADRLRRIAAGDWVLGRLPATSSWQLFFPARGWRAYYKSQRCGEDQRCRRLAINVADTLSA